MEWNINTPSQWDWDNLMMFNGKVNEVPKQVQPTDWGIEGDGGNDNGSFYSSGGGGCSGSDLGNGSSSKSSISASVDSSSKGGTEKSSFNFENIERFVQDSGKKKELGRVKDSGTSPTLGALVGSGEPVIGLKLGRRTYFEDVSAGSTVKPSSFSPPPPPSTVATKKSRASFQSTLTPRCQVEGCNLDLTSAKDYHRRHRVCESHSKCPRVVVAGLERRFCQQCSRFHDLLEFDEKKRSCRRRLSDHNARRRKPQPDAIHYNSGRMSSSFYDGRQQMNLLFDRVQARPAAKPTWQTPFCVKPEASHDLLPSAISSVPRNSDRFFPFKITTNNADVLLSQGLEAAAAPVGGAGSNMVGATPEFRRALSLLSNNSGWSPRSGNNPPESTCLDQFIHANANHSASSIPHSSTMHAGWPPIGSSEYWQPENQADDDSDSQVQINNNNGGSQFQEFQLFKAPFENGYYSSNHIN